MSDLISREAAIDDLHGKDPSQIWDTADIEVWVNALPSAQPERKHGHWLRNGRMNVYGGFEVECSVCHDNVMITNIEYEHYCRNCGARMDEEEVSE